MSHLGRWLSAPVDEELDGAERDRVLNHLARCAPCRQEANALRALKRRMLALGEDAADSAIVGRLIELARSDSELADRSGQSRWPASWPAAQSADPPWSRHQVRSGWMLAASSAGLALTAIGAVAFLIGGAPSAPVPRVTPAVETYWLQHGYDSGQAPAGRSGAASTRPAAPGSQHGQQARPGSARAAVASPAASPGAAGGHPVRPGWTAGPAGRPGRADGPSAPAAYLRHSP